LKKIKWDIHLLQTKNPFWTWVKWYEFGGLASLCVLIYSSYLFLFKDLTVQAILWINLFALLIHQFEEYGYPGWFPGMLNRKVFGSEKSLSYPLNKLTSWVVNVPMAWSFYLFAIIWSAEFPSLGLACILLSLGNLMGHLGFSIKGRTWYHPGLISALCLFAPVVWVYLVVLDPMQFLGEKTMWNGILFGVIANAMIPLVVLLLARENSRFEFGTRHEVPEFRKFKDYDD
jgi:Protein of unknown function with HXXEE motif